MLYKISTAGIISENNFSQKLKLSSFKALLQFSAAAIVEKPKRSGLSTIKLNPASNSCLLKETLRTVLEL